MVKLRSEPVRLHGASGGFGLVDLLASFALFDDDPARVNTLVARIRKGDARADPENGAGISAAGKPHRARCHRKPGQSAAPAASAKPRATRRKTNGATS